MNSKNDNIDNKNYEVKFETIVSSLFRSQVRKALLTWLVCFVFVISDSSVVPVTISVEQIGNNRKETFYVRNMFFSLEVLPCVNVITSF